MDQTGFKHLRGGYRSVYGRGNCRFSLSEPATNILKDFNMSATMARQGGRVQLEQSDMRLALNMAKMAKGGCSRAAIERTLQRIKMPRAEVREEKKWGVEFPGHGKVKAGIEWHPATVYENQTDGCLPYQDGTPMNTRTCWRGKGRGAPPQVWPREPTSELTPPPPGTPPVPSGDQNHAQSSKIPNLPAGFEYTHAPLHGAQLFSHDTFAEDSEHDEDLIPDLRNDEETYTG